MLFLTQLACLDEEPRCITVITSVFGTEDGVSTTPEATT